MRSRMFAGFGACALLVAGCGTTSTSQPAEGPAATVVSDAPSNGTAGSAVTLTGADWPTFGHDAGRTGAAPADTAAFQQPSTTWHAGLDGAVYGQPLVVGGTVYAATENDSVYALRAADGHVLWRVHVATPEPHAALPCGDIDPLGITSTPVFDAANDTVYALAETDGGHHRLVGIDAANGTLTMSREAEPPKGTPLDTQQRSALTLLDGRVYIAYGGLAGDCDDYVGGVVAVPVTGSGPELSYAIPTTRTGGIWTPGGAAVRGGELLYSVGNGAATSGSYDGSDAVFALSPTLARTDSFTPSSWGDDNANDLDLGSMSPALVGGHVVIAGKRGTGYVLDAGRLGGIGGQIGEFTGCAAFGSAAVAAPTAYLPCTVGVTAVRIAADGTATRLWTAASANSSPVFGDGAVWAVSPTAGRLYALDPATGAVRAGIATGSLSRFASPSLSRGTLYLGTLDGVVAIKA